MINLSDLNKKTTQAYEAIYAVHKHLEHDESNAVAYFALETALRNLQDINHAVMCSRQAQTPADNTPF